jgi:hypothetical protein
MESLADRKRLLDVAYEMRFHNHASRTMLARARNWNLFLSTRVCLEEAHFLAGPLTHARLSMFKSKLAWGHAHHLVEAPAEVALVGESGGEGDVYEWEVCACEQLLRAQ